MASNAKIGTRWDHGGRRAERLDVQMQAALRPSGAKKFSVDVIDISVVGVGFGSAANLHIGDRVWLTVPGMAGLESHVVWRNGHRYGCEFIHPLYVAVFDHIIQLYRKSA